MLVTDMKEKDTQIIIFRDIEPDVWEKAIQFLQPGGSRLMQAKDILTLLPVQDQYLFQDGLAMCDDEIFSWMQYFLDHLNPFAFSDVFYDNHVALAVESHRLNLPKSMEKATEFAEKVVKRGGAEQRHIQALMPLIVKDKAMVKTIVSSVGKEHEFNSVKEMKEAVQTETFVSEYVLLSEMIGDVQQTVSTLNINDIHVWEAGSSFVNGEYAANLTLEKGAKALNLVFQVTRPNEHVNGAEVSWVKICSVDPFGKT